MQVFNTDWHKIHFGVYRDRVVLYVNCEPVGEQPLEVVDSRIDLNGEILIAKEADTRRTVAVGGLVAFTSRHLGTDSGN